jgi:hypothetical protein
LEEAVRVTVGLNVAEGVPEAAPPREGDPDKLSPIKVEEALKEGEGVTVGVKERVGEVDTVGLLVRVTAKGETLPKLDPVIENVGVGLKEGVAVSHWEGEAVTLPHTVTEGVEERDGVAQGEGDSDPLTDTVLERQRVGDREPLTDSVEERQVVGERVLAEEVVGLTDKERELVWVTLPLGEEDEDRDPVGVTTPLTDWVRENTHWELVTPGLTDTVPLPLPEGTTDPIDVALTR